jgi:6 kDa early secretory antigenic target
MAVDGRISVTFEDLENARDRVFATAGAIDGLLSDLSRMLAPLVAEWTGEASVTYQYQQRLWHNAASDLHATLIQIHSALSTSHASYTDAENIVRQYWAD